MSLIHCDAVASGSALENVPDKFQSGPPVDATVRAGIAGSVTDMNEEALQAAFQLVKPDGVVEPIDGQHSAVQPGRKLGRLDSFERHDPTLRDGLVARISKRVEPNGHATGLKLDTCRIMYIMTYNGCCISSR